MLTPSHRLQKKGGLHACIKSKNSYKWTGVQKSSQWRHRRQRASLCSMPREGCVGHMEQTDLGLGRGLCAPWPVCGRGRVCAAVCLAREGQTHRVTLRVPGLL